MKKDVIQSSDKDQDPSNENPAIDIHSNDFPVYEDRGHQIPTNKVPDCVNDQEKPDEVSEELNEADPRWCFQNFKTMLLSMVAIVR